MTDAATGDERVAKAAAGFTDDGAVDASISTCDAGANDSFNCGRCGNACAPGVCEESECRNVVDQGYYAVTVSPRGPFFPVSPGFGDGGTGQTVGLQIQVLQGGWVIGLGTLTEFGGTHGYLGLYRDTGGGQPSTLVAQTAEFTLKGDTRSSADPQPTVEPVGPVLVPAGYYWIFGTWNGDVAFAEQGGSPDCSAGCVNWYQLNGPFQPLPASLLPKEFQRGPEIILYAEIAIKPS